MNIEQLHVALDAVREQMRGRDGNNPREAAEVDNLKRDEARLLSQIQQLDEQNKQVETKVAEAQEQVAQSFDTISAGGQTMTLGDLAVNEPARQILSIYFSRYVTGITEQYEKEKHELQADNERLQGQCDSIYEDNNTLRSANAQLQLELTLMTAQRDAAAAEIDNEKKETARLNSQVDDLRTEIAVGARAAVQVVTNTNADLAQLMREYNEAKPAIYNIRWKDERIKNKYVANLEATGEEIEFPYLEKGKYREVTAEEAERFRAEQAASQPEEAQPVEQVETPVPSIEPPALPSDEAVPADDINTVPADSTNGEVVPETLEERVKALELAVFGKSEVAA